MSILADSLFCCFCSENPYFFINNGNRRFPRNVLIKEKASGIVPFGGFEEAEGTAAFSQASFSNKGKKCERKKSLRLKSVQIAF